MTRSAIDSAKMPRSAKVSSANSQHHGYTLLEVLLAVAISTIVIAALFMTIDLQLKIADEGRLEVEQGQLAHAILNRIADDLRNAVRYREQDMSGAFSAVEGSSALGSALETVATTPSVASPSSTPSPATSSPPVDEVEESLPIPGVYGTNVQIQMDVSRLPRVDEYVTLIEQGQTGAAADLLSDIKTVAYYVMGQSDVRLLQTGLQPAPEDDGQTGLYYRSINRAATEFAAFYGGLEMIEQEGLILSERITSLEFEYFDGSQWVVEWDATERQGNPVAVKIMLEMYPIDWEMMDESEQRLAQNNFPLYQTVVWLPTAEPTTTDGTTSSSTSSSQSSTSSDPSTTSGGGQ